MAKAKSFEDLRSEAFRQDTSQERKQLSGLANQASRRTTKNVEAATIDTKPQEEFRSQQSALAKQLLAQSRGEGPSLAQDQLKRATAQNIAGTMAMAASQRGAGAGLGMRNVAMQQQGLQAQAARDAATLRMQEQLAAQQGLAGVAESARAADINLGTAGAQLRQEANLANQATAQKQMQLNDQMAQFYKGQQLNLSQWDKERLMREQEMQRGINQQDKQMRSQEKQSERNMYGQMLGGAASGIAAVALSDERQKTKIKPLNLKKNMSTEDDADENTFLGAVKRTAQAKDATASEGLDASSVMKGSSGYEALGKSLALGGAKLAGAKFAEKSSDEEMKKNKAFVDSGKAMKFMESFAKSSDEDEKMSINQDESKLQSFVDALKGYEYEYKDPSKPGAGPGKYISPMAQDLEKSEIGKNMVIDTPEGKMVDYGRAGGVMLATAAMLNDKAKDLEAKLEQIMRKRKAS